MKWRSVILAAALAATAIAAYLAPPPGDQVVEPTARKSIVAAAPVASVYGDTRPSAVLSIRPRDEASDKPVHGGFAAAAWAVQPASALPQPVAAPPPPPPAVSSPMAPPLPFKVLGRYLDDSKPALFLQYNEQNLVVRVGDSVLGQYKVESLDDVTLTLLHLPTNQKQTLAVGTTR